VRSHRASLPGRSPERPTQQCPIDVFSEFKRNVGASRAGPQVPVENAEQLPALGTGPQGCSCTGSVPPQGRAIVCRLALARQSSLLGRWTGSSACSRTTYIHGPRVLARCTILLMLAVSQADCSVELLAARPIRKSRARASTITHRHGRSSSLVTPIHPSFAERRIH
jgi:hypothetical protein